MNKTIVVLLIGLAFAGMAQAQIQCWTDKDGKRACGDAPPPGAKVTKLKAPASAPEAAPPASSAASKDAKKGPLTTAEKEQEYRRQQAEAQKAAQKADQEKKDTEAKRDNCARSRETLQALDTGQRIQRIDAKGERYFIDDAQREQETARARQLVQENCN